MDWYGQLRSRISQNQPLRHLALVPFFSIFVALGVLLSVAGVLANAYHREQRTRADTTYQAAQELARKGQYAEAVNRYRAALSLSRSNRDYKLALASALIKFGRSNEAEAYLSDLLIDDPTSGIANLLRARLMAEEKTPDAELFYHRAVYGYWPPRDSTSRIKARFELAELLVAMGENKKATGELLQLQDELPDDPAAQNRAGRLLLQAGSPSEAATVFREVVKRHRRDAAAYAGLGEAEFARGEYQTARNALQRALTLGADDAALRNHFQIADEVARLDPTLPRLGAGARASRSRQVLSLVVADLTACHGKDETSTPEPASALLQTAQKALSSRENAKHAAESADADIALAEQLAGMEESICAPGHTLPEPLALILSKLAEKPEAPVNE